MIPTAPTIASPAKGSTIPMATAVTIKITPVAGATHYFCGAWESGSGGYVWTNKGNAWTIKDPKFGTSSDCTIPADDPAWAKIKPGKLAFVARSFLSAKTKKGVEFIVPSAAVSSDFMVVAK